MDDKNWYGVDLFRRHSGALKTYLRENDIYFEPSEMGPLIHFECRMTEEECEQVNKFLDGYFAEVALNG